MSFIKIMVPLAVVATLFVGLPPAPHGQTAVPPEMQRSKSALDRHLGDFQIVNLVLQDDDDGRPIVDAKGNMIDPRGPITVKGPKLSGNLKTAPADIKKIRSAVGYLECGPEGRLSQGTLYGNGIALATARHSIFDGNGNMFDACWLRKQGNSEIENTKIDLRQATIKIIQVTDSGTIDAIALVRPKNRLVNKLGVALKGVPLDEPGEPLRYRQKVALVSALQLNKSRTEALIDYNVEPIVQECRPQLRVSGRNNVADNYGDCWMTEGATASAGFIRKGQDLAMKTICMGGGWPTEDRKPFKIDGRRSSLSYCINLDSDIVEQMIEFEKN